MKVSCPGTRFSTELPDSTATTETPHLGEVVQGYCGTCDEEHYLEVVRR